MRTKTAFVAAIVAAASVTAAHAQIGVPGITLPAAANATMTASQALLAPGKPGVVTLHDAAQENTENPKVASGTSGGTAKETARPVESQNPIATAAAVAQVPQTVIAPQTGAVLPLPIPVMPGSSLLPSRPKPDVSLVRISSRDGIQRATLLVKGATRAGLTVGDKVLKLVLSEFRDDGVCLDASLHKPKCATFIPFANE